MAGESSRRDRIGAWLVVIAASLVAVRPAAAQYPQMTDDVRRQSEAEKAAADRRSDEAFARAMPEIEAWAKKGKPFIQDASKPSDLPQATIPAFPGAEGGGMHSFGGRGGEAAAESRNLENFSLAVAKSPEVTASITANQSGLPVWRGRDSLQCGASSG